ncbi:MAG: hypothetical protein ABIS47_00530 [Acidimicrobiales bacterium]
MRRWPPGSSLAAALVALTLVAVAACSGGGSKRLIPPPPISVAKITKAPPGSDYTGVNLDPVEGKVTTVPVEVLGGDAAFSGIVLGPDGPVSGATVRLERFVDDTIGRLDVTTNGDGTWRAPQPARPPPAPTVPTIPGSTFPGQVPTLAPITVAPPPPPTTKPPLGPQGILGGRYRVRAWRPPDLALTTPQILFLEGGQNKQLTLQLSRYDGISVGAVSSPDPPILNAAVNVTAVVTSLSVDPDGVVRSIPAAGLPVELNAGAGFSFSGGPTATNAQGRATFQLTCVAIGQGIIEITVNSAETFALPVKPCVAPLPTTTAPTFFDPTGSSSTSVVSGPSSTARGGAPAP